jgi:hypothetical protein
MPLLLGHGMSLFEIVIRHWSFVIGPLLLMTNHYFPDDKTTSLLLSSLSFYFFQYVKERFAFWSLVTGQSSLVFTND